MSHPIMRAASRLAIGAAIAATISGCGERTTPPKQFATAEAAADALVAAAESYNVDELKAILGSPGVMLVETEDRVADRNNAAAFAAEAKVQRRLELDSAGTKAVLVVGAGEWPVPMPIVKGDSGWAFDTEAGLQEVLFRRIGRNELDAIEVARGYVEAQKEYALTKHDGAMVNQYAQRVISSPGKQDGLAWQAADSSWQGPVGEGVARLIAEGYRERYEPFHGYYFKVLKGQGPAAPLGEMDFVVDSAMIGGFALVAAPAEYEVTGVQSFIVSHDGIVYQKDLGENTLAEFQRMERYNPDSTWTAVPGE